MPFTSRQSATTPLNIKVSREESDRLKAEAAKVGMTPSALARLAIGSAKVCPVVINPICETQWRELSRVGSNLNQIAYHLNYGEEVGTEEIRTDIREALNLLGLIRARLAGSTEEGSL